MSVTNQDLRRLADPFKADEIDWKIQTCGKGARGFWGLCVAYIDSRAIMNRFDEVCGPSNWWNEFKAGPDKGVLCGLSVRTENGIVTKWDGAENTDIEAVKGGLSDSTKRAAVQWGIGRYLYNLGETWAEIVEKDVKGSRRGQTKDKEQFFWLPPALPTWALPSAAPPKARSATEANDTNDIYTEALRRIKATQTAVELETLAKNINGGTRLSDSDKKRALSHAKHRLAEPPLTMDPESPRVMKAITDMLAA